MLIFPNKNHEVPGIYTI